MWLGSSYICECMAASVKSRCTAAILTAFLKKIERIICMKHTISITIFERNSAIEMNITMGSSLLELTTGTY